MVSGRWNMAKYRNYVECPRWARFGTAARKAAYDLGLDIEIHHEKGLFRKTVFFTLEGSQDKIELFVKSLNHAIREWNSE
jgi:hypothetical protein